MSDIRIRAGAAEDEPRLADLERRTWSPLHAVAPCPPPGAAFFDEGHRPDAFLVAEVDGRLAGFVRVVPATSLASNAHVHQIQGLAVDDWARGRGVARSLLAAAGERSRSAGARRLTLRVLGHNTPARRLYEAVGFVVEGVLPEEFVLDGRFVDDVLMGLRLD